MRIGQVKPLKKFPVQLPTTSRISYEQLAGGSTKRAAAFTPPLSADIVQGSVAQ
jgi:hypothetical protein